MKTIPAPFSGAPPEEVPLPRAPLVRVLAQVTFPLIAKLAQQDSIADFQERIRARYPLLTPEAMHHIEMSPGTEPRVRTETVWRFSAADQAWRVSLATSFVALETTAYTSRDDFVERLTDIARAFETTVDPKLVLRVGVRYINRIEGEGLDRLADLIEPEVLGVLRTPFKDAAQHLITEAMLRAEEGQLLARWGSLPAGATIDPQALAPLSAPSWILDLDLFTTEQSPFSADAIGARVKAFARRQYAVFRSIVKPAFLEFYGGKL
jgi:uncharacterized protein (TIGR04255 family)